jgi:hypothetical protein
MRGKAKLFLLLTIIYSKKVCVSSPTLRLAFLRMSCEGGKNLQSSIEEDLIPHLLKLGAPNKFTISITEMLQLNEIKVQVGEIQWLPYKEVGLQRTRDPVVNENINQQFPLECIEVVSIFCVFIWTSFSISPLDVD